MAKTEQEIVQNHKRTLEAFTGKKAEVTLKSKEEILLNKLTIIEILSVVETFNTNKNLKIRSHSRLEEITYLRKMFFLMCKLGGKSVASIAKFMSKEKNYDRRAVNFHIDTGNEMLATTIPFQNQYKQILSAVIRTYEAKLSDR